MDLAPDEPERQGGKRATRSRNEPIAVCYSSPRKNMDLECDDDVECSRGVLTASRKLIREEILAGRANPLAGVCGRLGPVRGFFISENAGRLLLQRRPVQWHGYLVVWLTTAYAWAFLTPLVADDSAESGKSLTKLVAGPQGFEEDSQFSRRSA